MMTDCLSGSHWCLNNGARGRDAELCGPCKEREDNTHDGRHDRCVECGTEEKAETFRHLQPQIVGTAGAWETVYRNIGPATATREKAWKDGLRHHGHDDFIVAEIQGDRVVAVWWDDEARRDEEELAGIERALAEVPA